MFFTNVTFKCIPTLLMQSDECTEHECVIGFKMGSQNTWLKGVGWRNAPTQDTPLSIKHGYFQATASVREVLGAYNCYKKPLWPLCETDCSQS